MLYYAQNFYSLQSIVPMKNYNDMALALAGVCQSVLLISQLAQKGDVDHQDAFQTTIHSLLITQPEDTLAVFGGDVQHLKLGLNTLIEQLTQLNDKNLLNYWGSLLALESKLNKQPEIKQELGRRIARLPEQLAYHDNQFDDEMFSIMANIYVDTHSYYWFGISFTATKCARQNSCVFACRHSFCRFVASSRRQQMATVISS